MNISITARKFKARETLKEFVNSEVSSLQKFFDNILDADVILSYQNIHDGEKCAEIILQVPGQILTAKEESDDFTKSVSAAVEKLSRQLEKLKNKRVARKKNED